MTWPLSLPDVAQAKDYYQTLGVERTASEDDIRRAYRRLARQYHPDVNKDPDAAHRFGEISEAYDVLSDAEKRRNYDRFGHTAAGAQAGPGRTYTWRAGPEGFGGDFHTADFSDLFEQMFRGGGAGGGTGGGVGGGAGPQAAAPFGRAGAPRARRGQDVEHEITVAFLVAALGGTEQLRIEVPGRATETIDVKIPAGIEDGARLRVRGRGQTGAFGGAAGDLLLRVRVGEHPYFRRGPGKPLDVLGDVALTIAEAALGAAVTVPLLKGTVEIKVPPGACSGQRLRVKGKGITDAAGRRGDFYAVIQIVAPASLSDEGRSLLERLAPELQNPRESGPLAETLKRKG